eukprot:jgi/Undpi1/10267/HiC_scaffold_28.g12719.m1
MDTLPKVVPSRYQLTGVQTALSTIQQMRQTCFDGCQALHLYADQISAHASRMTSPRQLHIVQAMQAECVSYNRLGNTCRRMMANFRETENNLLGQLAMCQNAQDRIDKAMTGALAVGGSSFMSFQDMLDLGADVNHRSPEGETHLHHAARMGIEEAVELLLQAGADERACTPGGRTAVDLLDGPHRGIRLLLQQASDRRRERGSDRRHCGWIAILRKRRNAGVAGGDGGGAGARPEKLRRSSRLAQKCLGEEGKEFLLSGAPDEVFKKIIGFL